MPQTQTPACTHIFADTHRCGSPAMRGEQHCYYHHPNRKPVANPYERRARRGFQLAVPDSPHTLRLALNQVLHRLAANQLDVHRAGQILYTLQLLAPHLAHTP
jgi:hypothetical protein